MLRHRCVLPKCHMSQFIRRRLPQCCTISPARHPNSSPSTRPTSPHTWTPRERKRECGDEPNLFIDIALPINAGAACVAVLYSMAFYGGTHLIEGLRNLDAGRKQVSS